MSQRGTAADATADAATSAATDAATGSTTGAAADPEPKSADLAGEHLCDSLSQPPVEP